MQGPSGRRPSAPVEAASTNGPSASLGISRLSAPGQAVDTQQHDPTALSVQAPTPKTHDAAAAPAAIATQPAAIAHPKSAALELMTASAAVAAAGGSQQVHSQGEQLPAKAGPRQRPAEAAAHGANSVYYNMGTADRPLSSFAQRGWSTGAARPAGGGSSAAAGKPGVTYYTTQAVETAATASMALGNTHAAGERVADAILASAAPLAGTLPGDITGKDHSVEPSHVVGHPGQHQEGFSAEPWNMVGLSGQHQEGYPAEPPYIAGLSGQHQEGYSAESPQAEPPLPSPVSKPNQAGISPQNSMPLLEARDYTQQQPLPDVGLSPHPPQWHTEYGPTSLQHQDATAAGTAAHAVAANQQRPGSGHDVGHVAVAPGADMGGLLPTSVLPSTLGLDAAASRQSRAPAASSRVPNIRIVEGDVARASPSAFSSSFLGQSLDLSKVNCQGQSICISAYMCKACLQCCNCLSMLWV